jgi:hypothetical protein
MNGWIKKVRGMWSRGPQNPEISSMMLSSMMLSSMLSTLLTLGCLLIVATTAQATTKQDLVAVQMFTHVW